jgi:hypothetical protein
VLARVEPCEPEGMLRLVVYIDLVGLDETSACERQVPVRVCRRTSAYASVPLRSTMPPWKAFTSSQSTGETDRWMQAQRCYVGVTSIPGRRVRHHTSRA